MEVLDIKRNDYARAKQVCEMFPFASNVSSSVAAEDYASWSNSEAQGRLSSVSTF